MRHVEGHENQPKGVHSPSDCKSSPICSNSLFCFSFLPFFFFCLFVFLFCVSFYFSKFFVYVSKLLMTDRLDAKQLLLKNYNPSFINSDPFSSRFYPQGNCTFLPFFVCFLLFFPLTATPQQNYRSNFPFFHCFFLR